MGIGGSLTCWEIRQYLQLNNPLKTTMKAKLQYSIHTLALASLFSASSLQGATIFSIVADAVWETNTDWSGAAPKVVPGTTLSQVDLAGVNGGRKLTLNSDASGAGTISTMNVGNQNPGTAVSTFTMTSLASLSVTTNFYVGPNGSAGHFIYNDGASLSTATFLMGKNNGANGAPASSTVTIALGTVGLTNAIGTTTLNLRQLEAGQNLIIDASSYTGSAGDIDLITFTNHTGGDFNSVSITGLDAGLAGAVSYDADSVNLNITSVPEPSSTALLGLGGLALIFRRRK